LLQDVQDSRSDTEHNQIEDGEQPQRDPAVILIAPDEIQIDLDPGVTEIREITVANNGDEPLEFTTFIDVISAPVHSDIENLRVLILTDGEGLNDGEVMIDGATQAGVLDENMTVIGSMDFPEIDLYDYDVLVFTGRHRWQFYQVYMWYQVLIDEWIRNGGVCIMSGPGVIAVVPFALPGGVWFLDTGFAREVHNICELQGEYNPLIHGLPDDDEDDMPQDINVGSCNKGVFPRMLLDQNMEIENVKTFYVQEINEFIQDNGVTLLTYEFGEGYVLGSSLFAAAFLYQPEDLFEGDWMDGALAMFPSNIFKWAEWVRRSSFINLEPDFGVVNNGNPLQMELTFDTELVVAGDYEVEVHFYSNDENNEDLVLNIELTVSNDPDIHVEWERYQGFPEVLDWNLEHTDLYVNEEYEMTFFVLNYGTNDLDIQEIRFEGDGADLFTVLEAENIPAVGRLERVPITCRVTSGEPGDFNLNAVVVSSDPDMEELEIPIHADIIGVPSILVDPLEINSELEGAEIAEEMLTISNGGEGPLKFNIIEEIINQPERDDPQRFVRRIDSNQHGDINPQRDMPGDVLGEFVVDRGNIDQPGDRLISSRSITLFHNEDDGLIYGQNSLSGVVMGYDPAEDYRPTRFFSLFERYIHDMAYHDGVIYGASPGMRNSFLFRYDMLGTNLGNLDLDWGGQPVTATGVTYVPEIDVLLVTKTRINTNENELHVFSIEGEHLADMGQLPPMLRFQSPGALEWVPEHPHGQLWLHSSYRVWQMEIDTENWEIVRVVQDFETFGYDPKDGITHDGENLFLSSRFHTVCRIVDDGIDEDDWLKIDPIRGTVELDDEMEIVLTLDGTNQVPGEYQAELHIHNNDPENPLVDVAVNVAVDQLSDIQITWPMEAGFNPDDDEADRLIVWNSYFPDLLSNQIYEMPLVVKNIGFGNLEVSDVTFESDVFTIEPSEFQLGYWEEQEVVITLNSEEDGNFDGSITFISNDPNNEEFTIPMEAVVSEPPQIVVEPAAIEHEMDSGEVEERIVNLTNDGGSDLRWYAEVEYLDNEENRDIGPKRKVRSTTSRNDISSPERDVPEAKFLVALHGPRHPFVVENVFQRIRGLDYDYVNSIEDIDEIDFYDYDVLWFRNGYASEAYREWWDDNLERLEEYVSTGYTVYIEQGGHEAGPFIVLAAPGGLEYEANYQLSWVAEGAGDNYIIENMEWEEHQFIFNYGLHVVFPIGNIERIDNSETYEVILEGARDFQPGLVRYDYGFGNVVVSGMENEMGWREMNEGRWGSCASVFIDYLDMLSDPDPWVASLPKQGVMEPGSDDDIVIRFDSNGLISDDYFAELNILSNDPDDPLTVVDITLTVNGIPEPDVVWDQIVGYPNIIDFNSLHREMYARGSYPVEVTIRNIGFDEYEIAEITSNRDGLITDWDPETESIVPAQDEIVVDFMIFAEGREEINGAFRIIFEDEQFEDIVIPATGEFILGPILRIEPAAINDEINTGERSDHDLTLSNPGVAPLTWWTDAEVIEDPGNDFSNQRVVRRIDNQIGPTRDDAGDIIDQFEYPDYNQWSIRAGIAWDPDNEWMWFTQGRPDVAKAIDPANNYEVAEEFQIAAGLLDICWYDGMLYLVGQGGMIIARFDLEGNRLEDIQLNDWRADGIGVSYERNLFFIIQGWPVMNDRPVRVYEISEDGGLGNHIGLIDNYREIMLQDGDDLQNETRNLLWVDNHPGGNLWFHSRSRRGKVAWQFSVNFETWEAELVQDFLTIPQMPGGGYDGLGHDGEDLWAEAYGTEMVYLVDDGWNERGWISWDPEEGVIDPDQEEVVVVHLDARGVIPGNYAAELYFYSNDPIEFEEPDMTIDITLTVSGNANIFVSPGGEDEEPVEFGIAYFGFPVSQTVIVTNSGVDPLALQEVIRDDENPDFYVEPGDLEGFILEEDEQRELTIWYNPDPERGGVQEGTLTFISNANAWGEGYPVRCVASIGAFEAPVLDLEPRLIEADLREEQRQEFVITARNTGGSLLTFEAEVFITDEPENDNGRMNRNVRSVNSNTTPLRDNPRGRGIIIQQRCGWFGWEFEQYFQAVENLEYVRFRTWDEIEDVDLSEYNFMWIGNAETEDWVAAHNQNLDRLEAFVDQGGVIYHSSGTLNNNHNVKPINPGGLIYTGNGQTWDHAGVLQLEPEENFLLGYMAENDPMGWGWRAGGELVSNLNGTSFGYFTMEDIQRIDNSGGHEIIAIGDRNDEPLLLTYEYGDGYCIVNTFMDGYLHRNPQQCHWGRTGEAVIHYMDDIFMDASPFSLEPTEGEIEPDRDLDVFLRLNGEFILEGETRLAVHFYSNDPENPDQEIEVVVNSAGIPEIQGSPSLFPGENVNVIEYEGLITTNREYPTPVVIRNTGTSDLEINEITISDPENFSLEGIEIDIELAPREEIEGNIIFHPANAGDHECRITFATNASNVENGVAWWEITGSAIHSAAIDVRLPGDQDFVFVTLEPDGDPAVRNWAISNPIPGNGDNLEFRISIDDDEDLNRDSNSRQVRHVVGSGAPYRDDFADIVRTIQFPEEYVGGLACDGESLWYTISQGNQGPGQLYQFSIAEEQIIAEYDIHQWCYTVAFDGENLWISTTAANTFYIYNRDGEEIDQFESENRAPWSMSSDRDEFVYVKGLNQPIYVYSIENREMVGTINHLAGFNNDNMVAYIECVPTHVEGRFWGFPRNGAYQARREGNRLVNVQGNLDIGDWLIWSDVTHDGENFWFINRGVATCMDDGILDVRPDWLSCEPVVGDLNAGARTELTFTFNPQGFEQGEVLETIVTIESNDPLNPLYEIPVTMSFDPTPLRHFTEDNPRTRDVDGWVIANAYHTFTVTGIELEGEQIPLNWEIGVFTPGGALAGGEVWREGVSEQFRVYGDSDEFEEITGFRAGESFTVRVWDDEAEFEYPTQIDIINGQETWTRGGRTRMTLTAFSARNLVVELRESWNMISLNVNPHEYYSQDENRGPQVIPMFEQLRFGNDNHRVLLLKDENGRFWTPQFGFNNIPFWELTEGYQIKLSEATEAEFSGLPIEADADIQMTPGWNIIAYFPDYELDASAPDFYVLSPIIDFVELAKDDQGRFMTPGFNFSNMTPWRETKGYQVKIDSEEDIVLNYPQQRNEEEVAGSGVAPNELALAIPAASTDENMTLLIDSFEGYVEDGDLVIATGASGRILGTGIVHSSRCGLAIWGDDSSTDVTDGAIQDESFTLKLRKPGSRSPDFLEAGNSLKIVQFHKGNELRYEKDGFIVVDAAIEAAIPAEFYLSRNFPNPFNSTTTITYGIPEFTDVSINIYDVSGRFVESLVNGKVKPGHHKVTWSPHEAPTGVYIVRCLTGSKKESMKVALIR